MKNKNNKGFIALTLVITISVLLLTFSYTQSIDVAHFFDMTLRKKYRLMNYYILIFPQNQKDIKKVRMKM